MYTVHLDSSYVDNFSELSDSAKEDVTEIATSLGINCYYLPTDDPDKESLYLCERAGDGSGAACVRLNGWDNWRLSWYFEYWSPSKVETVVLLLDREPLKLMQLPALV